MNDHGDSRRSYIRGWSNAGFIFYDPFSGEQMFQPSWAAPDIPSFFPNDCTVCASTRGLLLCSHPDAVTVDGPNAYTVCNPYIRDSTRYIPNPNPLHDNNIPRVLVVHIDPTTGPWDFKIVCALLDGDDSPAYNFDVYSSITDEWSSFGSHELGFLREDTGVSCGTKAYWLRSDAPMVAHFDTETNSVGNIALPDAYVRLFSQTDLLLLQLGALQNQLCVVVAMDHLRAVYTACAGGSWVCNSHNSFEEFTAVPALSRFEDYVLQVPFWLEDGRYIVWYGSWADSLRCDSITIVQGLPWDLGQEILPLVHTRLHPIADFPVLDFSPLDCPVLHSEHP